MTGPFGHSFQYVMEDNPFEQRFEHSNIAGGVSSRFLQLTDATAAFSGRRFATPDLLGDIGPDVFTAIQGKGPFGPIISGTLDLDNLDNVVRLAFHMGLCSEADRALPRMLAPLLEPVDSGLAAPGHARPLFERWSDLRRRLYEFLLLDRGEFAAKAMLTLAVELATDAELLGPDDWRLTDGGLLDALHDRSVGEHQFISQLVKRLRVGDLFECVAIWQSPTIDGYGHLSMAKTKRALESQIENSLAASGGPKLRVCVHYILDKQKTCRALAYRNVDTGGEEIIGQDSKLLLIGVFVTNARTAPLTPLEQRQTRQAVLSSLQSHQLDNLSLAPEPLAAELSVGELFG